MSSKIPFTLVTAFTDRSFGGNPAAVVFVDTNTATETLSNIAKNLAQPISAFVGPTPLPSDDETVVTFDIRWFTGNGFEVPLCGHGLLASGKVVSERSDLVSEKVKTYAFKTLTRGVVKAVKLEDGSFQIFLPSTIPQVVSSEERARLLPYIFKAFGRDVVVNEIAVGQEGFERYVLIELDEKENLGGSVVNADALRGHGYMVNVITTNSSSGKEHFVMRMFSPGMLAGGEDHVCGSAHCLLGPYWSHKKGIIAGTVLKSTQVSPRGGDLWLVWDEKEQVIRLKGQLFIFATGDFVWNL